MTTPRIVRYGTDTPLPPVTPLCAGPLALIFENGDLRYVKLGEVELLRRVYVAVRDHNWDTIQPRLSDVTLDLRDDAFEIAYTARHQQHDVDFVWQARISGRADGTIEFTMEGEALRTFRRNRIGFCVLHPMSCAGDRALITHTDGSTEKSRFPGQIAPQQVIDGTIRPVAPFSNLRALAHEAASGLWAKVAFAGEVFEMEDQRNWTDASFKSYGTPLALPFPVEVPAGTKIVQSITLTLEGDVHSLEIVRGSHQDAGQESVALVLQPQRAQPLPAIGLGMASHGQPLDEQEIERLRALHLRHLRVDLLLDSDDYVNSFREATRQARALDVELEAALFLSEDERDQLAELRKVLDETEAPIGRWLVFHEREKTTAPAWTTLAREFLADYAPDAPFGAGSNAYFTDINRDRPDVQGLDFVCYSINPQVHAFDNSSLVETLAAQTSTVTSAQALAAGAPVVVSPVTLLPRFNPNATGPTPAPHPGELPPQVDVRQMSLLGAAWTLGSLKYLLGSGVRAVTYFETTGWRGVMERKTGSPLSARFHATAGMVFPLYHPLADVGEFASGEIMAIATSDPLRADALAVRRQDRLAVLVANLTADTQQLRLTALDATEARVRRLDETTYAAATEAPTEFRTIYHETASVSGGTLALTLLPYASLRIDMR